MEDDKIIDLYFRRDQSAIAESQNKYESYCTAVAKNILCSKEDAEECVNDTWLHAWNSIPPTRPNILSLFLAKITRNIAIDRYRERFAERRGKGEISVCLEELTECVGNTETFTDEIELREAMNIFLERLNPKHRKIFMLRYWHMLTLNEVAVRCGVSEGAVKMSVKRTRESLRKFLISRGYEI